jgi:PAS domain S-box-containing protein
VKQNLSARPWWASVARGAVGSVWATFTLTIGIVAACVGVRYLLDPWMGDTLPLVTVFGAVAAAVWLGGVRFAVVATVLGYLACAYLFIEPRGRLGLTDSRNLLGLVAYLFTCALIIVFGEIARHSQAQAHRQREVSRVTLRSIGDAVITTDVVGFITSMNAVAEAMTGWTQTEALGRPLDTVFRIVNEESRLPVDNPATKALREGVVVGLANHTVLIRKDGTDCPIDDSAAPIRDETGTVSGCVLILRDVTAQRQIEREKANQLLTDRLLASIVESSDDAIISKSLDGVIQTWNVGAERVFGYSPTQAIGRHISILIPPERLAEEDQIIARLKVGERIDHFETERIGSDGRRLLVSLTVSPIKDADNNVVGASKIVRDVTRQKRAEADREKFATLVENSPDFIGMCNLAGIPFFVNRAGLEMVGLHDIEMARRTPLASFFFPEDRATIINEFLPSVLEKGHGEIEIRFRHFETGQALWMAYKVLTLPDASGRPVAFATISQDVTDRKRLADDLRRLAADLAESDRRKTEFLAMLAHELRNPLAPITNAARALRLGGGDGAAFQSASEMLERQVGQMARLVDDLLDMSRITRGKIELRREHVELAPIVQHSVEAVRAQYRAMRHELTVSLPSEPVYLDADPARLAQVVSNLLINACKFTDAGGQIGLSVDREGEHATIRVRDNGIGIAAEHLTNVFEMFAQVDRSLERSRDGLGIGLTLVKSLVEMHGGTVSVRSQGPGHGAEFAVRLPILSDAPRSVDEPTTAVAPVAAVRRRILIVDDSEDAAESLAILLQFGGHETNTAHDGFEAIATAERWRPDAVLLDIGLPGMNGYEACRRIRQHPWGQRMFLVALTGWGQEEDRQKSEQAGFNTHMVKPPDYDALLKLLALLPSGQSGTHEPVG